MSTHTTLSPDTLEITAEARAERLNTAGAAWVSRIEGDTAKAQLSYRVSGTGVGSVASRITAGGHSFLVDEPAALAGDDVAASPVEYALGALISCQIVVYRLYAQVLGIVVDDIEVVATGELDARTLFGIDGGPRAGFTSVHLDVRLSGPESQQRYQELQAAVDAHCPVLDLFKNPTPVSVSLSSN